MFTRVSFKSFRVAISNKMVSFLVAHLCILCLCACTYAAAGDYEGKVVKGNRNALFLVQDGRRSAFPDFYTFTQMGFNMSVIQKIPDDILNNMPMGTPIKAIAVYRGEDYMYHRVCSDPDRLVSPTLPLPHTKAAMCLFVCRALMIALFACFAYRCRRLTLYPIWVICCVICQCCTE